MARRKQENFNNMNVKKTIIILAALMGVWQGASAQEAHFTPTTTQNGSKTMPYLIESIDDLNNLAEDIANGVPKNAENKATGYEGVYFKLTTNLDYSSVTPDENGNNFQPIGFGSESYAPDDHPFMGIFDGDNHTISGIKYSDVSVTGEGVGLFGYVYYPAVIKNINLKNCTFEANYYVGAIVGESAGYGNSHIQGTGQTINDEYEDYGIYNCTVADDVTVTGKNIKVHDEETDKDVIIPAYFIGGIIGECRNMKVVNCVSSAAVKGHDFVGNITGRLMSSTDSYGNERGVIEDCYTTKGKPDAYSSADYCSEIAGACGPVEKVDGEGARGTEGTFKITLYADDTDQDIKNDTRLDNYSPQVVDVTFKGMTLKKDGSWNLVSLPFAITNTTGTPLEGADIRKLESTFLNTETGKLTLNCSQENINQIENPNNEPYLIQWTDGDNIVDPTFKGVTTYLTRSHSIMTDKINATGVYNATTIPADDKTMVCMNADGTLSHPDTDTTVNAFTGYFTLKDGLTSDNVTEIVLNFEEPTGINAIEQSGNLQSDDAIYDLSGRKITNCQLSIINCQLPKGIYIKNGKKFIIK